jgi:hypothetical protein
VLDLDLRPGPGPSPLDPWQKPAFQGESQTSVPPWLGNDPHTCRDGMGFRGRLPSCLAAQEPRSVFFNLPIQGQRERCYDPCPPVLSYLSPPLGEAVESHRQGPFIYQDTSGTSTRPMKSR